MYRIGELAQLYNLKTDTLRFYEKQGLLLASQRSDSGYRLYTQTDSSRLQFIIRAKAVGFTLSEIQELLSIELDKSKWACADVKALVDAKLALVSVKIAELSHFQTSLTLLSQACCGGPKSAEHCSILATLESSSPIKNSEHKLSIKPSNNKKQHKNTKA